MSVVLGWDVACVRICVLYIWWNDVRCMKPLFSFAHFFHICFWWLMDHISHTYVDIINSTVSVCVHCSQRYMLAWRVFSFPHNDIDNNNNKNTSFRFRLIIRYALHYIYKNSNNNNQKQSTTIIIITTTYTQWSKWIECVWYS